MFRGGPPGGALLSKGLAAHPLARSLTRGEEEEGEEKSAHCGLARAGPGAASGAGPAVVGRGVSVSLAA